MTGAGLRFDRPPSLDEWVKLAEYVGRVTRLTPWMIGDLVNIAEDCLGEEWTQYVGEDEEDSIFGVSGRTARNYSYVTRKIPLARRRDALPFSAHQEIVNRVEDPVEQQAWLDKAGELGWSTKHLRAELSEQEPAESLLDGAVERLERAVAYGRDVLEGEELAAFNKVVGRLAWTAPE